MNDLVAGWLVARGVLDAELCRALRGGESAPGAIVASADGGVARRSSVGWLEDASVSARLSEVVGALNTAHFHFEIEDHEILQVASYAPGDTYGWHIDLGPGAASRRKLSISVLLSDPSEFDGGQLEFGVEGCTAELGIGDAVIFPSYLRHRVAPVSRGLRRSVVGWFVGPPFR